MNSIPNERTHRDVLSVVIPAYNKPDYLRKCLESIAWQSYRPLQIIVSDDQSPNSLEPVIEEIRRKCDSETEILYIKPSENLRPYWNVNFALSKATGKYAIFMPHDDWVIDAAFFDEGVAQMEANNSCHICIGNSVIEGTDVLMMECESEEWINLDGREFVSQRLYKDLHPSYSAVIFNLKKLNQLDYVSYLIKKEDAKNMGIEPDEGFLMIHLLATLGNVAITGKVVSVRGNPPDSYSKTRFWAENGNAGLFIINMQLYRYYLEKGFYDCAGLMKKLLTYSYALRKFNSRIIAYLNGDKTAQWFMLVSIFTSMFISRPMAMLNRLRAMTRAALKAVLPKRVVKWCKKYNL